MNDVQVWSVFEPTYTTYTSPLPAICEIYFVNTLKEHDREQRSYE